MNLRRNRGLEEGVLNFISCYPSVFLIGNTSNQSSSSQVYFAYNSNWQVLSITLPTFISIHKFLSFSSPTLLKRRRERAAGWAAGSQARLTKDTVVQLQNDVNKLQALNKTSEKNKL